MPGVRSPKSLKIAALADSNRLTTAARTGRAGLFTVLSSFTYLLRLPNLLAMQVHTGGMQF